jgi:hypothetical protein
MKKILTLYIILVLSLFLTSCWDNKLSIEEAWFKMQDIAQQIQNWEITEEEWMKQMQKINKNTKKEKTWLDALKDQQNNVSDFKAIPDWAKELWAIEPNGLTLDKKASSVTVEDAKKHMNESFSLLYHGDADKIMSEAKRIIKALDWKISNQWDDYIIASWDLPWNHSLSISTRTDVENPQMFYSIAWTKKF